MTSRSRPVRLLVALCAVAGCSSASPHNGRGTLKDVVACATINVRFVAGFTVTQDWSRKVVSNGLAADSPAIKAAAQQFAEAATGSDQAGVDTATLAMESACHDMGMGAPGDPGQVPSS